MKNFHLPVDLANVLGLMDMEVDKVADMMMDMEVDKVADKVANMVKNFSSKQKNHQDPVGEIFSIYRKTPHFRPNFTFLAKFHTGRFHHFGQISQF